MTTAAPLGLTWKRREQIGPTTLYLGDCLEILAHIGPVDAVVSDPPYGIGFTRTGSKTGVHAATKRFAKTGQTTSARLRGTPPIIGDDRPFDPTAWLSAGNVLLWGADHFYPRLPDSGRWLAWNKLGDLDPWDSFADVEFAWHSREGASRIFSMKWKGLACDKSGEANGLREHPFQKPIRLMVWCLEQADVPPGGTVLDPYMGAGTTGVAALMRGCRFIGVEIEESYFDIACRRLTEAHGRADLFAPATSEATP
ncbi:MAG TPA: DNA methyltransferase [Kiloniellales bacterium]